MGQKSFCFRDLCRARIAVERKRAQREKWCRKNGTEKNAAIDVCVSHCERNRNWSLKKRTAKVGL